MMLDLVQEEASYLCAGVGDTDITARVTLLGELAGEELVEFSAEDTVGDELSLLADLSRHFGGGWRRWRTGSSLPIIDDHVASHLYSSSASCRDHVKDAFYKSLARCLLFQVVDDDGE